MYTLAASDFIAADADVSSMVTVTVFGMQLVGTTETYQVLYQGQVPSTVTTLYTVPTSTTTFIKTISIVNTDLAASHTVQLFRGGTAATNQITPVFNLPAGGSVTYEDGIGWGSVTIGVGTSLVNDVHTGYSQYAAISNPSPPAADNLLFYARKISGRMIPKWMPPSGVDNPVQPALFGNNIVTYMPSSSTNGGTATLGGMGISWTAGGTVSHPTPSAGKVLQMRRTQYSNVVTTTNQTLGIISTAAGLPSFWRGNAAGLGGFFFFCRFVVELKPADTVRLFVGLTSLATAMTVGDVSAATGNFCGLAHDTADGANVLWFITRDNTTTHKTSITGATFAAGQGFDFYMYAKPGGDGTIYYRLDDINAGTTIVDTGETNNLPLNTAFMGPQITMSNGTANVTATTVALSINRVYVESDY